MKNRHKEIVNPNVPEMKFDSFLKNDFAKTYDNFTQSLDKVEEEVEEVSMELAKTFDDVEEYDVHSLSKSTILECLDVLQAAATMVSYIASQRQDYQEILSVWKSKQSKRIKEYGLNG